MVDRQHCNFGEKKERTVIWEGPHAVLKQRGEVTDMNERVSGQEVTVQGLGDQNSDGWPDEAVREWKSHARRRGDMADLGLILMRCK